jgi:hypothetical protein
VSVPGWRDFETFAPFRYDLIELEHAANGQQGARSDTLMGAGNAQQPAGIPE